MSKIRILIADFHTLTREGIKSVLSRRADIELCNEVKDSRELRATIGGTNARILVIDFQVEGQFSIEDIAYVRKHHPEISILVISNNHDKQLVLKALDYGIRGYLLKECDEEEVLSAVYAAAKNEKFFCGRVMDAILEKVTHSCEPGSNCDHCQPVSLTEREVEIIGLIAEGHTTKDIAGKLFLSFHTVGTHRKNIFKKLSIRNSSELIIYALKKGLITQQNENQ
ncbi:MAG: hypothetical protein K0R65_1054 [Crocinitomicaceae bacterium]|jgi:DNA-binding NarL/FixJ family response regulator|nr:hypothetical protein [Crocinitomicaceae bacterium]